MKGIQKQTLIHFDNRETTLTSGILKHAMKTKNLVMYCYLQCLLQLILNAFKSQQQHKVDMSYLHIVVPALGQAR